MVSDRVSSDWFSWAVSVPAVLVVNSLTASVSEYGDDGRVTGIRVGGFIVVLPAGLQGQHPLTQQGSGADVRGGVGAQPTAP
jgi:hypothetical protein